MNCFQFPWEERARFLKRAAVLFSLRRRPAGLIEECALCDGKCDWLGGPEEGTCEALSFDELTAYGVDGSALELCWADINCD